MLQRCCNYGVKKLFISGLVFSTKVSLSMLERIHKKLVEMSGFLGFEFIDNRNIRAGLHLLEEGKKFLANNFLSYLNRYILGTHIHTHYPPHLNINRLRKKIVDMRIILQNLQLNYLFLIDTKNQPISLKWV